MRAGKAAESPQSRAAFVARELENRWPGQIVGVDLDALRSLSTAQAQALISRLCSALPSSSDGHTEAHLLTDLRRVILACDTLPDRADLDALAQRYGAWVVQGFPNQEPAVNALDALNDAFVPPIVPAPPPPPAAPTPPPPPPPPSVRPRTSGFPDIGLSKGGGRGGLGDLLARVRSKMRVNRDNPRGRLDVDAPREAPPPPPPMPGAASPPPPTKARPPDQNILLGDEALEPGAAPTAEEEPPQQHQRATPPPAERQWRADVTGRAQSEAYEVGQEYHLDLGITADVQGAAAVTDFEAERTLLASDPEAESFELTVQVDTEDFDIRGEVSQPLTLPREGPAIPAGFDVVPLHTGDCTLTGTVHLEGNFVTQLELTMPVGDSARTDVTMTSVGRPAESATTLEPRDIMLILEPAAEGGFVCTPVGGISSRVRLPITRDELALATDAVQQAMLEVVLSVDAQGRKPFASGIDIPEDMEQRALQSMARAGGRLFQQLFNHPGAGADVARVGEWLRQQASASGVRLTVQVVAHDVPIPWALLYLGPVAAGAELSWDHFLGARHVVEQIPFQMSLSVPDQRILSTPSLSVGVNANRDIDTQFGVTLVVDHLQHWTDLRNQRHTMNLMPRSTRASVVAALADPATADQIQYFYCHATSKGKDGNPDGATLQMGLTDILTLADLNLDAPQAIQLDTHPLVFINACESGDLSPLFYAGFVPYFMAKGARGVIGTECRTPALFAVRFAEAFFDRLLDGRSVGDSVHEARREFLEQHRNPLGLLYAVHCDADTRVDPALTRP
jgi:hypothetical protein